VRPGVVRQRGIDRSVLDILAVPERAVMDVMGWSNAVMVKRYAYVTARLRRDIADRLNTFLWAPNETKMRLAAPDPSLKRSSARSIAWSEVVVRGGVELPTFRFSEGFAGPGRSIRVRPTGPDDALATFGVREQPHISTVVVSKALARSADGKKADWRGRMTTLAVMAGSQRTMRCCDHGRRLACLGPRCGSSR